MGRARVWVLGALFAALAGGALAGTQKVKMVHKATPGSVGRYKTTATITLQAAGMMLTLEQKETEKVTFTAVAANGDITSERETESRETTVNGMPVPDEDGPKVKTTIVVRPNGTLVSFSTSDDDKESQQLNVRLFPTTNVVFPDRELGVGDKWSHEFKGDTSTGARDGKADYELTAFEKHKDIEVARIKLTYKENEGSPALSATGTMLVEKATGDTVVGDWEVGNVPFPGPGGMTIQAQAKIHQERDSGGPGGGKVEPAKEKTVDEVVKDYEKLPGVITLYRKKETGKETVYAEIREDQLDKLFLIQATASTGNAEAVIPGDPLADTVFQFSRLQDDRLVIRLPNVNFLAAEGAPIKRAVKRAFPDAMLDVFKIEARQPERKTLLINVSSFFTSDFAQIGRLLSSGGGGPLAGLTGGGGGGYTLDREKTFVSAWKNFPDNLVVETSYHFQRAGGGGGGFFGGASTVADSRSLPLRVQFNLWSLAGRQYVPRIADPRVGYFYTEYQDFTDDGRDTQMVRYILRWDVQKQDPTAAVSPPKKPIVFWLDNAIPAEYREAVRDGLLMWNKAFLKIGIQDAIQVKQMPDDADWDHADMRYNVIRWSTTVDPPYGAIALFRVNPLTGEIVNAGITVDAILTRSGKMEKRRLVDPATAFDPAPAPQPDRYGRCRCGYQQAAVDQAWFGFTALEMLAAPGEKPDEAKYTNDFLRSIVAHELGHVLGLFHNFAASTQFSLADLKDPTKIKQHGVIGSVMDYVPFNISALKQKSVDYWTPTVGRYDEWAVEYGYSDTGARKPEDEEARLKSIAARGNAPGHRYHNDFFADGFDPAISRFDLGAEPLDYWQRQIQVTRHLLLTLDRTEPKTGKSYWDFTRAFNGLMNVYAQSAAAASRYVGGMHLNRNFKGDPGEKPVLSPVDGARQKRALRLLNDYLFAETALRFPKHYYSRMAGEPFPSFTGGTLSPEFPVRDQIANLQRNALRRTFSSTTLGRIANTEYKAADPTQVLTLAELFASVGAQIWSEIPARRNIPTLRRQLQRSHLDILTGMVLGTSPAPDDARMLAWDQLRSLKARIQAVRNPRAKGPALDSYTRIHLDETLMRINRALNAVQTLGGQSSSPQSLLQLLLGREGGEGRPSEQR